MSVFSVLDLEQVTLGKLEPIWGKPVLLCVPCPQWSGKGPNSVRAVFVWLCRDLIRLVKLCQTADSHKDCCIIETATITANPGRSRRK